MIGEGNCAVVVYNSEGVGNLVRSSKLRCRLYIDRIDVTTKQMSDAVAFGPRYSSPAGEAAKVQDQLAMQVSGKWVRFSKVFEIQQPKRFALFLFESKLARSAPDIFLLLRQGSQIRIMTKNLIET